jgi:hypothetical protein
MRTVEKISVALGAEDYAWAKQRAKEQGGSVSAVLSEALKRLRQSSARARLLQGVQLDPALLRQVEEELYGPPSQTTPKPTAASRRTRGS